MLGAHGGQGFLGVHLLTPPSALYSETRLLIPTLKSRKLRHQAVRSTPELVRDDSLRFRPRPSRLTPAQHHLDRLGGVPAVPRPMSAFEAQIKPSRALGLGYKLPAWQSRPSTTSHKLSPLNLISPHFPMHKKSSH